MGTLSKALSLMIVGGGLVLSAHTTAQAAPLSADTLAGALEENPLVQDARLVCVNRRTGRILYYGPCRGYRPVRRFRFVCVSRSTGRILYRGRCR